MSDHRNLVSDRSPFLSFVLILITVFIGFVVVGPLLGFAVGSQIYDGNLLNDLQTGSDNPGFFLAGMVVQGIAAFVGLVVFPVMHIRFLEHKSLSPFFPDQPKLGQILLAVVFLGVAFLVAISPISEWNSVMHFPESMKAFETWAREKEDMAAKITESLTHFSSLSDVMLALLVIAVLPGVGEELVFRGMIQRELWRSSQNIHLAIWTSAFIFSAIHIQFFGFFPRLLLGALFGYVYYWSDNLWVPIFAHFVNNAMGVVGIYMSQQKLTELNMEDNTAAPWPLVLVGVVATAGLSYFIWNHYRQNPPNVKDFSGSSVLPHQDPLV
ncbi:CPBP family intramembrane glutamic endopeptidase [Chryseolinea lacunae]|nr:CPBP family intramembrane glutamic endopeptidase [Chryseolinea lacunae]